MSDLIGCVNKKSSIRGTLFQQVLAGLFSKGLISRPAPVVLISFPKSGRTWVRLLLGRILQQHFRITSVSLFELHELSAQHPRIPVITVSHDDSPFLKTSDALEISKEQYRDKKVIFLARDPRDIIVSAYFQKTRRVYAHTDPYERTPYQGTLTEYVYEPVGGIDTIIRFFNIWVNNRHVPKGFLLLRYEDLIETPQRELRRSLDFMGLSGISQKIIDEAVQFASFENMRKMEENDALNSFRLRPGEKTDRESYKTRRGKVGGYRDYLAPPEIEYLNQKIQHDLSPFFGYDE
jgi:hypothetical protein